ncbi:MAG TPA: SDR family NAD(P)-dependent oxidoreductase [Bacteroidota bacterium]|nr:SDR family NAD(P)-dependent oxidoreductase [Bacteroidota bacterium]
MIHKGDIAFVTGGGRGIGRAVSLALSRAGMSVIACSRTLGDVEEVAGLIEKEGGRALALQCDVANPLEVEQTFKRAASEFGPIDLLVNNAGVGTVAPYEVADYEIAEWDRIVNVNLRGTFLCCRAVLPSMRERRKGTIINVVSITGREAAPLVSPYGVSKFGAVGLTQGLLAENFKYGIRICMVNPGPTNTTIWDKKLTPLSKEVREAMMHSEDVAEVVLYMASLPERVRIDEIVVLPNQFPVKLWDYRVE